MFGFLKKKISGFVDKLTKKEEEKAEKKPREKKKPEKKAPPKEKEVKEKIEKPAKPKEIPKPVKKEKPVAVPKQKVKPPEKIPEPKKEEKPVPPKRAPERPEPKAAEKPKEIQKPVERKVEEKEPAEKPEAEKKPPEPKPEPAAKAKEKPAPEKPKTVPEIEKKVEPAPEPEPEIEEEPEEPPAIEKIEEPAEPEVKPEKEEKPKERIKIGAISAIKSFITKEVEITEGDVGGLLEEFELELLESDVDLSVAESIREELREKLIGSKIKKDELHLFINQTMKETLVDMLSNENAFDILERMKQSEKPVRMMFLGINGAGKCVTGDTIVPLTNGKMEMIKDIYEKAKKDANRIIAYEDGLCINNEDIEIFSLNMDTWKIEKVKPSYVWKLKTRPSLIKVRLGNGSEIKVTPEHPFFTIDGGKMKKIKAEEIKEGICVATPKIMRVKEQNVALLERIKDEKFFLEINNSGSFYKFLEEEHGTLFKAHGALGIKQSYVTFIGHWKKRKMIPLSIFNKTKDDFEFDITGIKYGKAGSIPPINCMSEELAEFLGLILAEGHLDSRELEVTNKDKEIIKRFEKLTKKLFKLKAKIFVDERGLIRARIMNATLVRFLQNVFEVPIGSKGTKMKIPDVIFTSSDKQVASFLMAYIEADGHLNKDKQILEISTSSKKAADGLVFLLHRLGLIPTISKKRTREFLSYRITVSGYGKISRIRNFGFYTTKNLKRLDRLRDMNRQFELTELIPNTGALIRESRQTSGYLQRDLSEHLGTTQSLISQYESHVPVPRNNLERIAKYLNDKKLKTIAQAEVCWMKVEEVERIKARDKWVYDLTVEGNHNFVANNTIIHNTTTIAKVAKLLLDNDYKIVFAAADTFRAAAIEQMQVHADRLGVRVIKRDYGSDPTSVAYDATGYAKAHGIDAVLIDTAGRQDTNISLINEMKKMTRVIQPELKIYIGESIAGQAILEQIKTFDREIGLDAVILTKLDCDPKGGTMLSINKATGIPIIYVGVGQRYEDLELFDTQSIVDRIVE